jgi:hypothetical protein
MPIRPVEHQPGCYFVTSATNPSDEYLVDMDHDGVAVCGCRGFEVRKKCHHIEVAKMYDSMIKCIQIVSDAQTPDCQCGHCKQMRELFYKLSEAL